VARNNRLPDLPAPGSTPGSPRALRGGPARKKTRLILVLLLVALGATTAYLWSRNIVSVVNNSTWEVQTITVTVCGRDYTATNIQPGQAAVLNFAVTGDSRFAVAAKLSDGTILHSEFGYVTAGGFKAWHNRATVWVMGDKTLDGRQGQAEGVRF
jgi:hypothetical protein